MGLNVDPNDTVAIPTISVILPTAGRPGLARTLVSIVSAGIRPYDEVVIVGDGDPPGVMAAVAAAGFPDGLAIAYEPLVPAGGCVGQPARNLGVRVATRNWLLFTQDDNELLPGALDVVRQAVAGDPLPHVFRVKLRSGLTLWRQPPSRRRRVNGQGAGLPPGRRGAIVDGMYYRMEDLITDDQGHPRPKGEVAAEAAVRPPLKLGDIDGDCLVVPNVKARLGEWGLRYDGDFDFITSTLAHYPEGPVWHEAVIAHHQSFGDGAR